MDYYKYESSIISKAKKIPALGPTQFNKGEHDTTKNFILQRPYIEKTTINDTRNIDITPYIVRAGIGNYNLERNNFCAPDVVGRQFDLFPAMQLVSPMNTVELGEKTISKLFDIKIPDSTDREWINEETRQRARLTPIMRRNNPTLTANQITDLVNQELKRNLPLGREQRYTTGKQNIAQSALTNEQKLNEINEEIKQGRALNIQDKADLMAQLALVLGSTTNPSQFNSVKEMLSSVLLGLKATGLNWKQLFPSTLRIVSGEWIKANKGLALMYFMSYVPVQNDGTTELITMTHPIFNLIISGKIGKTSLDNADRQCSLGKLSSRKYIDLIRRALIDPEQALWIQDNEEKSNCFDPSIGAVYVNYVMTSKKNRAKAQLLTINDLPNTHLIIPNVPPPTYDFQSIDKNNP
jgi:hypothetical protein